MKLAEEKTASALNATDADLKPFKARGGKLIVYHGWNDPAIPALNTVNYYQSVAGKMGQGDADSFVRLYMVPGMQHCGGGPGPGSFGQFGPQTFDDPQHSMHAALEQWVEKGAAPSTIIASKYRRRGQAAPEDDAAAVRVSASREVQGQRRYERCGELCVREIKGANHEGH